MLEGTAAGLAATLLPHRVFGANDKLNHACIGTGGVGWGDFQIFKRHKQLQVVALCDVDRQRLDRAAKDVAGARVYADWRELIDKEGDRIDSVNASVPDHMHARITLSALKARKHVYCQKPLCHDVAESRAVADATKKAGVVTQLGTQSASGIGDRMAVQFLRQGIIGRIKRVILCANRPGAIKHYRLLGPRPAQGQAPPAHLNWDLWLGTAPERPFAPGIYHPTKWRAWQDFGTGWSGDIGCHIFDHVWKGLGLTAPKSVQARVQKSWAGSPARRADTWPQSDHITWLFPGNELTAEDVLPIEWYDGLFFPPEEIQKLSEMENYPGEAAMLIGTKGAMLQILGSGPLLLPRARFKGLKRPKLAGRSHHHHFVDACRGGEKTESHFVQTGPMTEAVLLGTVAIRVPDTVLQWDPAKLQIPNHAEADKLLRRTYRKGWEVEGL
ncbi:Gfo/Idh/MocA family oxidoreductase [bacterium]|nr:Gfo/Idh/MocA family oxidoreductase [bacterium]